MASLAFHGVSWVDLMFGLCGYFLWMATILCVSLLQLIDFSVIGAEIMLIFISRLDILTEYY